MEKVYRCPIRIGHLALTLCCVAMLGTAGLAATPGPSASDSFNGPLPSSDYRFDYYAPPPWMYPGYRSPLPGPWVSTAAHPYPPGYIVGPYAPMPFSNYNPRSPRDKGTIEVFLPVANARVYLNGELTRGTGMTRILTTPVLPLSQEYQYYVTATYESDGHSITKYRKIDVGAGEFNVADFTRPGLDNPINLPAGLVDQNEVIPAQGQNHHWPAPTYPGVD